MSDTLRVDPQGAKVTVSLDGIEVLGSFVRGDGKTGVTHPCAPIFGPDRKHLYGLKQHGDMRNETVDVRETDGTVEVSHAVTDSGYPAGMTVRQVLSVADGTFSFAMTHTNTGTEAAAVNAGEHCYFDAPRGYAGTTVNGVNIDSLIEDNVDGIAVELRETNSIQVPGKPEYVLTQRGLSRAVVWVGKNPRTGDIDGTYVCIEPVEADPFGDYFGSPPSLLGPQETREVGFTIRASRTL